jgi:hypothetical protein
VQGIVNQTAAHEDGLHVTADFPRSDCPIMPIGAEVTLGFQGPYLPRAVWAAGRVIYRREELFRHRYRFRFDEEARVSLASVVNSRRAMRLRPHPSQAIPVVVQSLDGETEAEGWINDVSATGMSLRVSLEVEEKLYPQWGVAVRFQLPGADDQFRMVGSVCYRHLVGDAVHYGIDFDPQATEGFEPQHTRITAIVDSASQSSGLPKAG